MKKLLTITMIVTICLLFINVVSYATDLTGTQEEGELEEVTMSDVETEDDTSNQGQMLDTSNPSAVKVQSMSDIAQMNLGINNIVSILLVAIGVILIFLSIAIIIKIKR